MNAFFGGMWSGMAMITDLDRHVIDRFLAAPALRFAIVLSQVVRAGVTAILQALILLLVALALGVRVHGGVLGWLVVFAGAALLCAVFAGFSHGIALLMRRESSMIAAANFVGMPLMFLSSILVTTALMPGWITAVARFNPVNWGTRRCGTPCSSAARGGRRSSISACSSPSPRSRRSSRRGASAPINIPFSSRVLRTRSLLKDCAGGKAWFPACAVP